MRLLAPPRVQSPDPGGRPCLLDEQVLDGAVVLLVAPSLALDDECEGGVLVDEDAREWIHHVENAEGRHRARMLCPVTGRGKVIADRVRRSVAGRREGAPTRLPVLAPRAT